MRTMIVAFIILSILTFTSTNYTHKNPEIYFENNDGEKLEFMFSSLGAEVTCKYHVDVTDATGNWTLMHDVLGVQSTGRVEKISATGSQWMELDVFIFNGDPTTMATHTETISDPELYRFTVLEDEINYEEQPCGSFEKPEEKTATEEVLESCYGLPISGTYQMYEVNYDYTDDDNNNYTGTLELTDNQKQATTLLCKDETNLLDLTVELEIVEGDYPWLQEYLDKYGYNNADISLAVTDASVRIKESDMGPQITVSDPNITEVIGGDVSGEIRFNWGLQYVGGKIHIILNPANYPFSIGFEQID